MNRKPEAETTGERKSLRSLAATVGPRSLAFRVIAFSTGWAILALIVILTVISTLYRQSSERGFDSLLSAHLFNLIGSVSVSGDGRLIGRPNLGDLRFSEPGSGWYWAVEPISEELSGGLRSSNMTDAIAAPPVSEVPFAADFRRVYVGTGPAGEKIKVIESEFVLDAQNRIARFRMMGNLSELDAEIARFERRLSVYLLLFGAGMILINAAAILLGLQPLARVRNALALVRQGTAQRLDGRFPAEIEPLASETNALIDNNKRIVDRSRTQVGNLAHSLKTPLAVLVNEGRALGGGRGRLIADQAALMQEQIEHYLNRARVAAQRDSVVYRTPVTPLLQRLARVMEKLGPGKKVTLSPPPAEIVFAGESEDLEEIVGNLLDNALKWSRHKIAVAARELPRHDSGPGMFQITVDDDGPGIPEERAREAVKRGRRLDETKPGSGLGLSIVAELVGEYGGRLSLERSELGGLKAVVELRSVG
ncbi:MAG: ATP-binding protein [Rhizobiaceae bacterium]|nr:ATP-binding protein [Rhizobiaceae bacterium]